LKDYLPPVLRFQTLDSTNEEALRQLTAGCATPLWILAEQQTHGRGRGGRRWDSPKGNLYATLVIRTAVSASVATQLSFVAGLGTYDAIASHIPAGQRPALQLKWPNDVMLGGGKLAGVLLESLATPHERWLSVLLGIGINISKAPEGAGRPVACLGLSALEVEPVFQSLATCLHSWLAIWDAGKGFAEIRQAWLGKALALNEIIRVHLNGSQLRGRFRGLDQAGSLQLETEPGVVIKITAGDVYLDAQS
jgi:BirA family transcriptional regulator, biotin operon repressor / biotin---[acetyl-CoA-carboxylase] ligase